MPLYQPPTIPGLTVSGGVVTINDNSADQDFRVESDDNTHMLYVDAGNDRVAVGTDTPLAPLHVSDSGAGDVLIIESTDAGATAAPDIVFYRNSASAATGDVLGRVEFRGRNAANNADISWAILEATAEDATGGGEDGRFTIKVTRQGSEIEYLQLGGIVGSQRTMVFNDTGSDIDFRVEGASAPNALFVEGSSGNVGIGTATPASTLDVIGDVRFRASVEVCTSDPAPASIETGTVYQFTKGSAGVFTLPVNPPVGTQFVLVNGTANDIVITRPASGVKINGATANATNTTAYAATSIVAVVTGTNAEWLAFGGI
jgi:hypothetical protein